MKNIQYKTAEIPLFYSANRLRWDEFYPSERRVFEKLARLNKTLGSVLDVGCACGGLGQALSKKFALTSYTGVDIHEGAVKWASKELRLKIPSRFIAGDIAVLDLRKNYDTVVSLSCADWNIETKEIVDACWKRVKPGGYFVISLRLTPLKGINDIGVSYQRINFSGDNKGGEIANYVVFNFGDALKMIKKLSPSPQSIGCYGYWGKPSPCAVTPFNDLAFGVFYIKKGRDADASGSRITTKFDLPEDLIEGKA